MKSKSKFRSLPQEQILWILPKGDKLPPALLSMIHDWGNMSDQVVGRIVWVRDAIVSPPKQKLSSWEKLGVWILGKLQQERLKNESK